MSRDEAVLDRRDMIVAAATNCFIAKGFHQTSMRDIATAAGISLGNFYNHFPSKDALIAEIARIDSEELEMILGPLAGISDPRQAMEQFLDGYLNYSMRPENVGLTVEITAEAYRNPDVAQAFVVNRRNVTTAVADILKRGQETGEFTSTLNTDEVSQLILDSVEALALRLAFSGGKGAKASRQALHGMIFRSLGSVERMP